MSALLTEIRQTLADNGIVLDSFHYLKHDASYHLHRSSYEGNFRDAITALVNVITPCDDVSKTYYTSAPAVEDVPAHSELTRYMVLAEVVRLTMTTSTVTLEFFDSVDLIPQHNLGRFSIRHYVRDRMFNVGDVFNLVNVHESPISLVLRVEVPFTLRAISEVFNSSDITPKNTNTLVSYLLTEGYLVKPGEAYSLYAGGHPLVVTSIGTEGCAKYVAPVNRLP